VTKDKDPAKKRTRISQQDIPSYSLDEALRIPQAIYDNYAGAPTSPLKLAVALDVSPGSGGFKMLTGASIAYGLTTGGAQGAIIEITPLAKRILKPTVEGDDHKAKVEALLKPRITNEFLTQYNGHAIPQDNIAINVLEEKGVPSDRSSEVLKYIITSARGLSLITDLKGKQYVELSADYSGGEVSNDLTGTAPEESGSESVHSDFNMSLSREIPISNMPDNLESTGKNKRVFITHGKNKSLVEPIKELLKFGEMEAVVSVDRQSTSKPVPDKVMDDMRSCGAAIIHVEGEEVLIDNKGEKRIVLNPNVLIEIGAAMALDKKRFILLTKNGVNLPSNLQGLYEVRYENDALDGDATIRLLKAINELKATQ